jgi:hypothetical protein
MCIIYLHAKCHIPREFLVFLVDIPCSGDGFALKTEAASLSEMLVSNHHTTWSNNPGNHKFYLHHRENLKSCFRLLISNCPLAANDKLKATLNVCMAAMLLHKSTKKLP